eukprot:TRINITY_DN3911_c0_g1_i1.p1 TRINITY_DN3911_c0_g1~~TRINITY_DN3911_c0_g1_i1.p1  ORF type:complete len:974 (+),score=163.34 TRINITY_DN3911_c0_g1_i1:103-2922(+)
MADASGSRLGESPQPVAVGRVVPPPVLSRLQEGRVWKQSQWVGAWRERWMSLTDGQLRFFSEEGEGPAILRRPTASLSLDALRGASPVGDGHFKRSCCFIVFLETGEQKKSWSLNLQANSEAERDAWVSVFTQASKEAAERLARNAAAAAAAAQAKASPAAPEPPSQGAAPKARAKPKSVFAPPPPPPPRPKSKAAPKARTTPKAPPLGRRLAVQSLSPQVSLDKTVFSALVDEAMAHSTSCNSVDSENGSVGDESRGAGNAMSPRVSSDSDASGSVAGALGELFTPRQVGDHAKRVRSALEKRSQKGKVALVDNRVAQNVAIVLKRLRVDAEQLRDALKILDFDLEVETDELKRLQDVLPSVDQLRILKDYKGDVRDLRDIERDLKILSTVDRLGPRLHIIALRKSIFTTRKRLWEETQCIRMACTELTESILLRDVLRAVLRMFNFINHGIDKLDMSTVKGFDITSALRIGEFKAVGGSPTPFGNFTGLHFVVTQVLLERPAARSEDFVAEFPSLRRGSALNLAQINRDAAALKQETEFVEQELIWHRDSYADPVEIEKDLSTPVTAHPLVGGEGQVRPADDQAATLQAPLLSPVPEDRTARPGYALQPKGAPVIATPRNMLRRFGARLGAAAKGWRGLPRAPPSTSCWLRELEAIRVPNAETGKRPRGRWRGVSVCSNQTIEVHGAARVRVFGLRGALVESLSSCRASKYAAAWKQWFPHGIEVGGPTEEHRLRFACSSQQEESAWIGALRNAAVGPGFGWLESLRPSGLRAGTWCRRRWYVAHPNEANDIAKLQWFQSADAAWRRPAKPMGVFQIDAAVSLEQAPDEATSTLSAVALLEAQSRPFVFAVREASRSSPRWHFFAASSLTFFEEWMRLFPRRPSFQMVMALEGAEVQAVGECCDDACCSRGVHQASGASLTAASRASYGASSETSGR